MNRIFIPAVILTVLAAMPGTSSAEGYGDDDWFEGIEGPVMAADILWAGASLILTVYNRSMLEEDSPGVGGGAAGLLVGSATTLLGFTTMYMTDHEVVAVAAATTAIGVYTAYIGVKTLGAARRKNLEKMEQGLSLEPIMIEGEPGRLVPGIQVSLRF